MGKYKIGDRYIDNTGGEAVITKIKTKPWNDTPEILTINWDGREDIWKPSMVDLFVRTGKFKKKD